MADSRPLFAHPRLIAAAMLVVLTAVTGAALYVRPLSIDTQLAHGQSQPPTVAATLD
jgi:hypothetical protein